MSNYIEPTTEDIDYLQSVQHWTSELARQYKNKKHSELALYAGIALVVTALLFGDQDPSFNIFGGVGLLCLLMGGVGKHSYTKGEGKTKINMYENSIKEALSKVKCKWNEKDGKYYVFLEDNRRIEVDEY